MRKAIILTLVLACIALFAVACQQQPQAGRAFDMPSYQPQDFAAQPTYYQDPAYTAQPYLPEPSYPGAEIGTSESEGPVIATWIDGEWKEMSVTPNPPAPYPNPPTIGVTESEGPVIATWIDGEWKEMSVAPAEGTNADLVLNKALQSEGMNIAAIITKDGDALIPTPDKETGEIGLKKVFTYRHELGGWGYYYI